MENIAYSYEMQAAVDAAVNRDRLKILEIIYYVAGGLTIFVSCFMLIYVAMFLVIGLNPHAFDAPANSNGHASQPPPAGFFLGFAGFFSVFVLLGWAYGAAQVYAGYCLRKRRHMIFVLIVAGFECVSIPWGTLLGVFTFIIMQRPSMKALFS